MIAKERRKLGRVPIPHATIEARRRTRRLAPGAIALSLLMVAGVFVVVAPGSAMASPNSPPPVYPFFVVMSTWVNATSATINYTAACSGYSPFTVEWGNTTNPTSFTQQATYSSSTLTGSLWLNFLEPSTTYDYKLIGGTTCPHHYGIYKATQGSFTTPADYATYLSGTVNLQGAGAAPTGTIVEAYCLGNSQYIYYATTSSTGSFTNLGGSHLYCAPTPTVITATSGTANGYFGYWNESVMLWGLQPSVSFVLPSNYVSNFLPTIFDYTNAPPAQGYTDIQAATGADVTEAYTYSWSAGAQVYGISGGASGSQTSSQSWSWESTIGNNEGTLCYAVRYDVSGTAQFNAQNRHWSFAQSNSDPHSGDFCADIQGFTMPQPWIHNSTAGGAYYLPGPSTSKYVNGLTNVTLWQGNYIGNKSGFTASGTTQTGLQFGFSLSFGLPGAPSVSATASEDWSQTISQSVSWGFTVYGESFTSVSCYNVLGEGGSQANDAATSIAIYYWQGYTQTIGGQEYPFCN